MAAQNTFTTEDDPCRFEMPIYHQTALDDVIVLAGAEKVAREVVLVGFEEDRSINFCFINQ